MKTLRAEIYILRDVALIGILLWAFAQMVLVVFAPEASVTVYILGFLLMDFAVTLAALGRTTAGMAVAGTLSCVWVAWKLYAFYAAGELIAITDYFMVPLPIIGAVLALLFEKSERGIQAENLILRKRVEEYVLIDDVTGLYNERAMYHDLSVMVHYARRNHMVVSLFMMKLRYEEELSHMLSASQFGGLVHQLGNIVNNSLRMEDRVYCLDNRGSMAVILTCSAENSGIVRARILSAVAKADYTDLMKGDGKPDLRCACKEYSEEYGEDMVAFKRAAESELVYDV